MDDHGDFDSVSWQREEAHPESSAAFEAHLPERPASGRRSESMTSEPQAGEQADNVDLAGIGREGVLEVTVDSPLKENDGTKDAYVSYLVTTHVSVFAVGHCKTLHNNIPCRPTSRRFRSQISPSGDGSPTSYSSGKPYIEITRRAQYLLYPKRTIWPTYAVTGSARNSHSEEHGHYIDSSNGVRYIPSYVELPS